MYIEAPHKQAQTRADSEAIARTFFLTMRQQQHVLLLLAQTGFQATTVNQHTVTNP
jgi:hypothetical protein